MKAVCSEYRIHNADIHLKEDCDVDDLVDVIEGSRVYIPCIYVLNKIDQVWNSVQPAVLASCDCYVWLDCYQTVLAVKPAAGGAVMHACLSC